MQTPIIETDRMILRPLAVSDADDIFARWTSDERVSKYMRWCTHTSIEDTVEWLKIEEENIASDKTYTWAFTLKESGYIFGSGGLCYSEEEGAFELGYNIMHKMWNQGYTTEAAKAILEFANRELGINKFVACHDVNNPASGAVMKKCGFVYVGDGTQLKFDGVTSFNTKKYEWEG